MTDFELMLNDFRLTTANIFYYFPDHPSLIQTYLWQDYDKNPDFPVLKKFLNFWEKELDGKLQGVEVQSCDIIKPCEVIHAKCEIVIN